MKTPYIIIILIIVLAIGGYAIVKSSDKTDDTDTATTTDENRVQAPVDVTLSVGDSKEAIGLSIKVNSLVQDSRCPIDVQCIQAGSATVNVTFKTGSEESTMSVIAGSGVFTFGGYNITFTDVTPAPKSTVHINSEDYLFTFHVESALSGNNI